MFKEKSPEQVGKWKLYRVTWNAIIMPKMCVCILALEYAKYPTDNTSPPPPSAQRNNYEILKMLLDRGASIPQPHDVKCSCDKCIRESAEDSLSFSLARINAYRALASPSLIALSSKDPILTAFELSNELKRLSRMEAQFREVYTALRKQVQELATGLVDHARTSYELEVLLNHNPDGKPWKPGEKKKR